MLKKSRARYGEHKPKKNDRDIISYEDMPLDDYEHEKAAISKDAVKKIIAAVCTVLVLGLIVFAFANRESLSAENISNWWTYEVLGNAGEDYPVDIVGTEVAKNNFSVCEGYVAYASDTSFVTLNSSGGEILDVQLQYSMPVLNNCKNNYIIYGIGGNAFEINSLDSHIYSGTAEYDIYTADIASNGVYALVTEGSDYLSILWVYNRDNNRIYKYNFSEYYITSVALNKSGSGCVACGITSVNGAVTAGVYVLDFAEETPISIYTISDDAILSCEYLTDDCAALIGQSASYAFKIGDSGFTTDSYSDMSIANYYFNTDTGLYTVALSRSGDGRSCNLNTYNSSGELQSCIRTDNKVDSLCTYKNNIAVLDGNAAYVYNTNGDKLYELETGTGSKQILLDSESTAYVLSVNQIRHINFEAPSSEDESD